MEILTIPKCVPHLLWYIIVITNLYQPHIEVGDSHTLGLPYIQIFLFIYINNIFTVSDVLMYVTALEHLLKGWLSFLTDLLKKIQTC